MHLNKQGVRILGIAESWTGRERSILAGVVMRGDLRIDGTVLSHLTIGGMDGTDAVISMFSSLKRSDINLILISGAAIAWYNIINPDRIREETETPVIIITYEDSEGLEDAIKHHFPGDEERIQEYQKLGSRDQVHLKTGHTVFLRRSGIPPETALHVLDRFTMDGRVPEPVRVARLIARSVMRSLLTGI
ncbi:MAG: DUF99 family protein [Methanocalculus sp.]|uniref:endonuclease dU n=1 Tax=Methanocalculus sp. TaxID=2004547 RepID=UPI00271C3DFC|nr:DUF99 family protein [Methanocalculus sp.]MDO9538783.1 DUF99 family protein [Methanocalculus sp.]